jgi:diaminohydroxyphosphoribosylaminopyrimidine deaminase/5-amino-6-(5-phosphoribosylamino)uracil reductase
MDQNSFMKKAFALAKKGRGSTGLNPMVGAVLIKDNKVIGKGFHKEFGGPHAEVVAIADAESRGNDVTSSTLVTSLEPCCHKGKKTPPCTDLIIEKKIKKVIYGSIDQNPKVKGRGIADLRRHRIETVFLDYEKENRLLNRGFLKVVAKNRPFVTLKICMTLDGMIFNKVSGSPNIGDEELLTHSNK